MRKATKSSDSNAGEDVGKKNEPLLTASVITEIGMMVFQRLKMELTCDQSISLLGIYPKESMHHYKNSCLSTLSYAQELRNRTSLAVHQWMNE